MTTRTETRASRPSFIGIKDNGFAWQVPHGDRGGNTEGTEMRNDWPKLDYLSWRDT